MAQDAKTQGISADVIVVGAGLAGLALGLSLAKADFSVLLLGPSERLGGGRTVALLDPSVRQLEGLGLGEALAARSSPLRRLRIVDDVGALVRAPSLDFDAAELGLADFGRNVENAALADLLEAAAARTPGIRRIEAAAARFAFGQDRATITTSAGDVLSAPLVAGADGRQSPTRRAAGIDERLEAYGQVALTGIFAHARPHDGVSIEFHKRGGPFTLVPLPAGRADAHRSSLVWALRAAEAPPIAALSDEAWARRVEDEAHAVFGAMRFEAGRGQFPLSRLQARRFFGPRAALVGEAAHALPPIGAQGFNLSLRDVAALADGLGDARARGDDLGGAPALARYAKAREADAALRGFAVDALNRTLLSGFMPADAARAGVLAAIAAIAPLRRMAMRTGLGA